MRIYLAGPDVFRADAAAHAAQLKEACAAHGWVGVFPLDGEAGQDGAPVSRAIFRHNVRLIDGCDAVLANLTPFRGVAADCGTAWELGYAFASGKRVHGYSTSALDLAARTRAAFDTRNVERGCVDAHGDLVEDFGLAENLMLIESIEVAGGVFVCGAPELTLVKKVLATVAGGELT